MVRWRLGCGCGLGLWRWPAGLGCGCAWLRLGAVAWRLLRLTSFCRPEMGTFANSAVRRASSMLTSSFSLEAACGWCDTPEGLTRV